MLTASIPKKPPVGMALFDLDGTLVAWDCQLLFRHFVVRREPWRRIFLPLFLAFLPLAPLLGATGMKRVFFSFLTGMPQNRMDELGREFADWLLPAVYPGLREEIERHRAVGHLLILASASPEFYVREIGKALGFHLSLGTPLIPGGLFPDLDNHKGEAKVRRLHQILPASYFSGGKLRACHGYTDSQADLPMLKLCEQVTLVNPSPALSELGGAAGWTIIRPARPWQSRLGFVSRALALLLGVGKDPAGLRKSACQR